MDKGQQETEKLLKKIEKRLNEEYAKAEEEISEKLTDYFRRFEIKDKKWQEWVKRGSKTEAEYKAWRESQLAVGQRWKDMKDQIAHDLQNTNQIARQIVNQNMPEVYAINNNFATYQVEHDAGVDTSFTLCNHEAVERLLRDDPDFIPPMGKKTAQRIAEGKELAWEKQQIQSVMIQGLLQGDSIPELADRISRTTGEKNRKSAIRNARTLTTGVQNAGRRDAYKRAQEKGVDLEQMWLATMDNRTRHSHRWIDREVRPLGEAFSNGCEYPGDPKGDPAEIYNCRCSLRGVVHGLEPRANAHRDMSVVNMSYEEWRDAKPEYQDIESQRKKNESIRRKEYNKYRRG